MDREDGVRARQGERGSAEGDAREGGGKGINS